MPLEPNAMLIDELMPDFDATIVEHIVVDAPPETVYEATRTMDFLQIHSPMMDAAMFIRGVPLKVAQTLGNKPAPPPPPAMRLGDMFDDTAEPEVLEGWLALAEVEGRELVFGAIGKVWQSDIDWKTVPRDEFQAFDEPDFAKIVVNFSVRHYGLTRTLLSYEARTRGTDAEARKKFLRYWWIVDRFVSYVMRAAVKTAKELAEAQRPGIPAM